MIEFSGYITGEAHERLLEKTRDFEQNLVLFATALCLPIFFYFAMKTEYWIILGAYASLFLAVPLAARIPKSQKEKKAITPKRIYTEGEHIVCITDKHEEYRLIDDVKEVLDCKTYYELIFPLGKISTKFICQKDLLTTGTLEEFEALFEGKITDLTSYFE